MDALYAQLPSLACQGLCHDSCGPVDMSVRERARIIERAGPVTCGPGASCSMLTAERRCGVYDIRPMICRLWGLLRGLRCPYGCEPERWLTDAEACAFIVGADRIGGCPEGDRAQRAAEDILKSLTEDEIAQVFAPFLRRGRASLAGRDGSLDRAGARPMFERPRS
jgi:Fe-S-cluster containining protein